MFWKKVAIVGSLIALVCLIPARANDDALLDLLVRKHLITEKDAVQERTEMHKKAEKEVPVSNETKIRLSSSLTELELYGDARVRYEARNGQTAAPDTLNPHGDTFQRDRARYRLRIGLW